MSFKYYDISDICVACGAPTIPGEQICRSCQHLEKRLPAPKPEVKNEGIRMQRTFRAVLRKVLFEKPLRERI